MKRCSRCGIGKGESEFYWRKDGFKYRNQCKECTKELFAEANKKRLKKNPNYGRDCARKWRANNREEFNAICKRFRDINPGKGYLATIKWREKNPIKFKGIRKRNRDKIRSTPMGNLNHRIGISMRKSLKKEKGGRCWESLAGYNVNILKEHLENLFTEGMTWELFLEGKIQIDHIIPKSAWQFELVADREFKQCWALANLQPLWKCKNLRKRNKF